MRFDTGIDHVAFVTFDPGATVRFYTEVLGAELTHCITAKGWGPTDYPDFVHFFFNIGGATNLAFFYYFGLEPEELPETKVPRIARHVALHCPTMSDLDKWTDHLRAQGLRVARTEHETITSIYFKDPNGYQLEMTAPNRPLDDKDVRDAERSIEALIRAQAEGGSIERMWQLKGELVEAAAR
jgi:catechol 2,3-dioxygenase-like lactoylglutathione lyase family enzyme